MATVRAFIKAEKLDRQGQTLIQLQYQTRGKRVAFSTGERVSPKKWDTKKGRVKTGVAGAAELNAKLEKLENDLLKIVRGAEVRGVNPTPEYIKEAFDRLRNNQSGPTLTERFEQFIKEAGRDKAQGTVFIYRNTLRTIRDFTEAKRYVLTFENVNAKFYDAFTAWLQTERVPKLNPNSTGRIIRTIRTFLNWATRRGYNENTAFHSFRAERRDADFEYLTPGEVETLRRFNFSDSPYLDRCRDVFVFGCLTGLRFSDLEHLVWENVFPDRLEITVQKTRETLTVPLAPETRAILDKYAADERPLPVVSNQKSNAYLKEVCKRAGLTEVVQVVKFNGGNRLVTTRKKWELITTHTARRTFVCTALEAGVRPEIVMKLTGHRTLAAFQRYIKITDDTAFRAVEDWAAKRQKTGVFKIA